MLQPEVDGLGITDNRAILVTRLYRSFTDNFNIAKMEKGAKEIQLNIYK